MKTKNVKLYPQNRFVKKILFFSRASHCINILYSKRYRIHVWFLHSRSHFVIITRSHLSKTKTEASETISCRDSVLKPQFIHWLVSRRPVYIARVSLLVAAAHICTRAFSCAQRTYSAPGYTVVVIDTKTRVARQTREESVKSRTMCIVRRYDLNS